MGHSLLGHSFAWSKDHYNYCADMKVSEQYGIVASRGNKMLGLIGKNITYKEKS